MFPICRLSLSRLSRVDRVAEDAAILALARAGWERKVLNVVGIAPAIGD